MLPRMLNLCYFHPTSSYSNRKSTNLTRSRCILILYRHVYFPRTFLQIWYPLAISHDLYKATYREDAPGFPTRSGIGRSDRRKSVKLPIAAEPEDWSIDWKRSRQDRQPASLLSVRCSTSSRVGAAAAATTIESFVQDAAVFHAKANWIDFQDGLWSTWGDRVSHCVPTLAGLYGENHLFRKSFRRHRPIRDPASFGRAIASR